MNHSLQRSRKNLSVVLVNHQVCHSCGACVGVCPQSALFLWNSTLMATESTCTGCSSCVQVCPVAALSLEKGAFTFGGEEPIPRPPPLRAHPECPIGTPWVRPKGRGRR